MRVTISNEIIDRTEPDGSVITRIPKRNEYLYLERESVLAHGEHGIVAELEPDRYYVVGGKDPDSTAVRKERGETLSKNYTYIEKYDPLVKMAGNQQKQRDRSQQQPESPTERLTGQKQQTGMAESKKGLQAQSVEQSVNVRQQQTVPKYSREQFRQIKLGQKHHLDTSQYWDIHLSPEQMKQLRLMQENAVNIAGLEYNKPSVPADVLEELRLGHKAGFDMSQYNWKNMDSGQLREIRIGLEHRVDVSQYAYPAYKAEQMKQLRLGLQSGLDIAMYRNPWFTDKQMYSLRCRQIFDKIKVKCKELFESVKDFFRNSSLNQIRMAAWNKIEQGLDRTIEALSTKEAVQGAFRNQNVPEVTLDDRIRETVQDIKELLVAQELVSEDVMNNTEVSEQMNTRIKEALDRLMQPENIQNIENQGHIIEETAKNVIEETGAVLPEESLQPENREQMNEQAGQEKDLQETRNTSGAEAEDWNAEAEEWNPENVSDKELFGRIGEEMMLEAQAAQDMEYELVR